MRFPKALLLSGLFAAAVLGGLIWYASTRSKPVVPPQLAPPAPVEQIPPKEEARLMPPAEPGLNLYTNSQFGFLLSYPSEITPIDDRKSMAELGYIPVCDPAHSIICFPYGKEKYVGTNFESAAFSVNIWPELKKESNCLAPQQAETSAGAAEINGVTFAKFVYGEAAMSHHVQGTGYRAFHENRCFELTERLASTVFEVWEPGTIKEFSEADRAAVQAVLDGMRASFKFQ